MGFPRNLSLEKRVLLRLYLKKQKKKESSQLTLSLNLCSRNGETVPVGKGLRQNLSLGTRARSGVGLFPLAHGPWLLLKGN